METNVPSCFSYSSSYINSDHAPIVLKPKPPLQSGRAFKYEAMWEDHEVCRNIFQEGWKGSNDDFWKEWNEKVKVCKSHLSRWHKNTFINATKEIHRLKHQIQEITNLPAAQVDCDLMNSFRRQVDTLWKQEEKFWGQRSRVKWLNYGDKNTKFFHASMAQRRDRNKIIRIKNTDGAWLEG